MYYFSKGATKMAQLPHITAEDKKRAQEQATCMQCPDPKTQGGKKKSTLCDNCSFAVTGSGLTKYEKDVNTKLVNLNDKRAKAKDRA